MMCDRENREFFEQEIQKKLSIPEFSQIVKKLRIFISNNRSNISLIQLLDNMIKKAKDYNDDKSIINLYGLKILLLENHNENLEIICKIATEMENLSKEKSLQEELALTYSYWWFIEKIRGKKTEGRLFINKAFSYIQNSNKDDKYIMHFVHYSYSVEY